MEINLCEKLFLGVRREISIYLLVGKSSNILIEICHFSYFLNETQKQRVKTDSLPIPCTIEIKRQSQIIYWKLKALIYGEMKTESFLCVWSTREMTEEKRLFYGLRLCSMPKCKEWNWFSGCWHSWKCFLFATRKTAITKAEQSWKKKHDELRLGRNYLKQRRQLWLKIRAKWNVKHSQCLYDQSYRDLNSQPGTIPQKT